jgi:hypothetical protein
MITSATIPSSVSTRLRFLAARIHALGPRPLFEFCCEIVGGSSDPLGRLEAYANINVEILDQLGGRDLPPAVRLIKQK